MAIWIDDECLGDVNKADALQWIKYQFNITLTNMNDILRRYLDLKISNLVSNILIEQEYQNFRGFMYYPYLTDQISKETWEKYLNTMYNEKEKLLR